MASLKIQDLLAELEPSQKIGLTTPQVSASVPAPVRKRIERQQAFNAAREKVTEWQPIVKKHREAVQLDFSEVRKQTTPLASLNNHLKDSLLLPGDALNDVAAELHKQGELDEEAYLAKERESANYARLMKAKNLLLYKELKAKRIKKIKSKLYRRIRNKKLQKDQEVDLEKLERLRVEERATLRHRSNTKFAKLISKYADKAQSSELQKDLRLKRQDIKNKVKEVAERLEQEGRFDDQHLEEDLEELEREVQDEEELQETDPVAKIMNRYNRTLLEEAKRLKAADENGEMEIESESDSENQADGAKGKKKKVVPNQKLEETGHKVYEGGFKSSNDAPVSTKKKVGMNQLLDQHLDAQKSSEIRVRNQASRTVILPEETIDLSKLRNSLTLKGLSEQAAKDLELADDSKFFKTPDDLQAEFEAEKQAEVEKEVPQDKVLKGWGSWTGVGVKDDTLERQKKLDDQRRKKIEELKQGRKDYKLNRIMINEKRLANTKQFMIDKLPFGYESREQFNREMETPLGREWVGEKNHRGFTKPSLIKAVGQAITPIDKKNLPGAKYL